MLLKIVVILEGLYWLDHAVDGVCGVDELDILLYSNSLFLKCGIYANLTPLSLAYVFLPLLSHIDI